MQAANQKLKGVQSVVQVLLKKQRQSKIRISASLSSAIGQPEPAISEIEDKIIKISTILELL